MSHDGELDHPNEIAMKSLELVREDLEKGQIGQEPSSITDKELDLKPRNDGAENLSGNDNTEGEGGDGYPHGFRLVFLTLGVMAFIFMVALDNYILGLLQKPENKQMTTLY